MTCITPIPSLVRAAKTRDLFFDSAKVIDIFHGGAITLDDHTSPPTMRYGRRWNKNVSVSGIGEIPHFKSEMQSAEIQKIAIDNRKFCCPD